MTSTMFKDTRNYAALIVAAGLFLPALTLAGAGDAFAVPIFGDPQFAVGVEPRDVEVADLDGDGTVDVVVPNFFDRTVSVMLGTVASSSTQSCPSTGDRRRSPLPTSMVTEMPILPLRNVRQIRSLCFRAMGAETSSFRQISAFRAGLRT